MCDSHSKADRRAVGALAVFAAATAMGLASGPARAQDAADAPAGAADAGGVLTRAPEVIEVAEAEYPAQALDQKVTGKVILLLTIDETGAVTDAVPQDPRVGHGLDEAAAAALSKFRFSPAEVDGAPAAIQILYGYEFTLEQQIETVEAPKEDAAGVPVGALAGELLERGTRRPLAGILVRLPALDRETVSDALGRFTFSDVPAGEVVMLIEDADFYDVEDSEDVVAGEVTEIRHYVERSSVGGNEITVVGRRPKKEVVRRTMTVEEIRTIPGTNGDVLKVVQNLPGAARIPFNGGDIVLRGGGHSLSLVNGFEIPFAFHFGGLRSSVGDALIADLDIYPGNYGVRYGRVNGGVVDVTLRRPDTEGLHGEAHADVFDAGAFVEGPVGDNGAFALGFRRSYIDGVLPLVLSDDQLDDFSTAPRYYDGQAVYDWQKGRHRFRSILLGSSDEVVVLIDEPAEGDPSIRGSFGSKAQWLAFQNIWDAPLGDKVTNHLGMQYLLWDELDQVGRDFELDFTFHVWNLREEVEAELTDAITLRTGVEAEIVYSHLDVVAPPPPKEGEPDTPLSTQEFLIFDGTDSWFRPGVFAEADMTFDRLQVVPGFRVDYDESLGALQLLPRLSTRYGLFEKTVVKGAVGLYAQRPEIDEVLEPFGNPDLDYERSIHYSLGFEQGFGDAVTLDVTGFYKSFDDLATAVDDPALHYASQGVGRAYGTELLVRHELVDRFYGWISYTWQKSERRDTPGAGYRAFDLDQPHNVVIVAQYKLTPTWEVGGRWRYVSGNPTSAVQRAVYDSDNDVYVPIYDEANGERLPAFHQLDLRVDKHWIFDTWRMTTYLDFQNVYNRKNPEGYTYNFDYTERETFAGLPFIPSFGVRGEF